MESTEVAIPYMDFRFGDEIHEHQGTSECPRCRRNYSSSPTTLGYDKCPAMLRTVRAQKVKQVGEFKGEDTVWEDDTSGWGSNRTVTESIDRADEQILAALPGDLVVDKSYYSRDFWKVYDVCYVKCDGVLVWSLKYAKQNQNARAWALVGLAQGHGFNNDMSSLLDPLNWAKIPEELKRNMTLNLAHSVIGLQWRIASMEMAIKDLDSRLNHAGYQMMRN